MMDERFCPEFFHTYRIARDEAISLLAPHYKSARRMSSEQLERKLNYQTRKMMETSNVWCFCRFLVVDPSQDAERAVLPSQSVEAAQTLDPAEPPYEMMREQEAWFYQFHGKF